jgi:hypothetical protein
VNKHGFANSDYNRKPEKFYLKNVSDEEKLKFEYEDKIAHFADTFILDNKYNMYDFNTLTSPNTI